MVAWTYNSHVHISGAHKATQKVADKYREGAKVTVCFNPDNVNECVLEAGQEQGALLSLEVNCILIVAGVVQLMTGLKETG